MKKYEKHKEMMANLKADENELALFIDQKHHKKEELLKWYRTQPSFFQEAIRVKNDLKMMEEAITKNELKELPQNLVFSLKKLANTNQKGLNHLPLIIAELCETGISVLKSTFSGYMQTYTPNYMVRGGKSSTSKALKVGQPLNTYFKNNYALLYQKRNNDYLRYELLRENERSATLIMQLPKEYRNTRITLSQLGRILVSRKTNESTGRVVFSNLEVGDYALEFKGDIDFDVQLVIKTSLQDVKLSP